MENKGFNALKEKIIREEKENRKKKNKAIIGYLWSWFVAVGFAHMIFQGTAWAFKLPYNGSFSMLNLLAIFMTVPLFYMTLKFWFGKW